MGLLPPPPFCLEGNIVERSFTVRYVLLRLLFALIYHICLVSSSLAPGAQSLIKQVASPDLPESERLNIKKQVRKLNVHDWSILLKAFDKWPFAPEVRHSFAGGSHS
jgi:transcription factor 1